MVLERTERPAHRRGAGGCTFGAVKPRVVFVCSGNICRSPMAEAMARQLERRYGDGVEFSSAGTHAIDGTAATPQAAAAAGELGLALRWHRARRLTDEVVESADLLVALDDEHLEFIAQRWPDAVVELLDSVPDPYGMDDATYRRARDQIGRALGRRAGNWFSAG
jgi:protein-tyrosine phosphatase